MDNTVLYHYFTATAVYGSMFLLSSVLFGRLICGVRVLHMSKQVWFHINVIAACAVRTAFFAVNAYETIYQPVFTQIWGVVFQNIPTILVFSASTIVLAFFTQLYLHSQLQSRRRNTTLFVVINFVFAAVTVTFFGLIVAYPDDFETLFVGLGVSYFVMELGLCALFIYAGYAVGKVLLTFPMAFARETQFSVRTAHVYSGVCATSLLVRIAGGVSNVTTNELGTGTALSGLLVTLLLVTIPEAVLLLALLLWMRYRAPRQPKPLNVSLLDNEIDGGSEIKLQISELGKGGSQLIS